LTRTHLTEQSWFTGIQRPSRYLGTEPNSVRKPLDGVEVTVGLAFPDVYEVAMSHLGIKILYHILNSLPWLAAERVFCPWGDMETALREHGLPLATLESGMPLAQLDVLGFSLQHELCYTNVLTMLDLAGIPFRASERDRTFPLVIAGGPACFNPEPVAHVFDAILIGDGEEAALEICRKVRRFNRNREGDRRALLDDLADIQGMYIPSFFEPQVDSHGVFSGVRPLRPEHPFVLKAMVPDIEKAPYPSDQVVPFSDPVHDRLAVEICRGCTRGCRFCQAGMIYRPARERSPETILEHVRLGLERTGYEDVSLLSLSAGDHSAIAPLLKALMDRQSDSKVAISLPSLRIDSLDEAWLEQIKRVRKTGFTLAPEAGTDRLRRVINKTLTNQEIVETARKVYAAGWKLIKLYFMLGLPGETEEDLQGIVRLSREVATLSGARRGKPRLHVSLATFVPKTHTPFMWHPQISLDESRKRLRSIQDSLHDPRIRVKWNSPEMSWMEGVFARGDRRLLPVVIRAWKAGARFDAWGDQFRLDLWEDAFRSESVDPARYLYHPRAKEDPLPWDHIRSGVRKEYLWKEHLRALEEKTTPDCRRGCLDCGVCDHETIDPVIRPGELTPTGPVAPEVPPSTAPARAYVLTFSKTDAARYLGHLELVRLFSRAVRRAGLSPVHSGGFHPTPKISFTHALPVGTESLQETVRIELSPPATPVEIKERLNQNLPDGFRILLAEDVTGLKKQNRLIESHYTITLEGCGADHESMDRFLASTTCMVVKETPKGERSVDARASVKILRSLSVDSVEFILHHLPGPSLRPEDVLREIFHLNEIQVRAAKILKTKQTLV